MTSTIFSVSRARVTALVALAALTLGILAGVTNPAQAANTPTLTVTPASIERPATGDTPATLYFSHTGCGSDCWVALDPGWSDPASDQAVKGKNADFGAANYWATDVTIRNKRGKGPAPDALGIKVRPGDGSRKFIRFTLNDSTGVVAEAKVWLTPRSEPQPQPNTFEQALEDLQLQLQNSEPEYLLNTGPANEGINCKMSMTGGVPTFDGWELYQEQVVSRRTYRNGQWSEYTYETRRSQRPVRSGEEFRLEFGSYRSSDFDFRWRLVSTVHAITGENVTVNGLPNNNKFPGGSFTADSPVTITYRVEQTEGSTAVQNGASDTCAITINVR